MVMALPMMKTKAFTTTKLLTKRFPNGHMNTSSPQQHQHGNQLIVMSPTRDASVSTRSRYLAPPLFASSKINSDNDLNNIIEPTFTKTPSLMATATRKTVPPKRNLNHGIRPIINFLSSIQSALSKNQRSLMTFLTASIIMVSILFTPLQDAIAAPSGGRMGGSFGGSSRSSGSSSSRSYSSPSRSYSRGFNQGYSSGYYSRPSVVVAPPVIGSYGYGYGYRSPGVVVTRGPSIVDVIIFGVFAAAIFSTFTAGPNNLFDSSDSTTSALGPGVTVAQISVALNVPNRNDRLSILSFLDRLSATASTDSRVGVSNLVSQVAIELLRQKRSIFAANTEYKHFKDADGAQRYFSTKAVQERSKFERENTNKYGGVDYSGNSGRGGDNELLSSDSEGFSPQATSAVVTIVISIDGDSTKLQQINNIGNLEEALTRIATDVKVDNCLRSAEVLWTPDDNRDFLSERDVIVDYPKLRSV